MPGDNSPPTCLIHDPALDQWLSFCQPHQVLVATTLAQVMPVLEAVQNQVEQEGMYTAGFLAYEAGPACDSALAALATSGFPLAWFGIYSAPEALLELPAPSQARPSLDWQPNLTEPEYRQAIHKIKRYISKGETYQVNFTIRLRTPLVGSAWELFLAMIQAQGSHYGAYIHTDDWSICSASPELFFELEGDVLTSRPMKGTARRGLWPQDDHNRARRLQRSVKNRAENVMIVDMVRNDLGRIAQVGSVHVPELFEIEQYPTLWQMTSTVSSRTDKHLPEIFKALFPPASITGAPKVRTTQIIAELENEPRRVYTGAIGYCSPKGRAQFNVAIRTVLVDHHRSTAEYGVGGGIVWDSTGQGEYEECQVKARVLTHRQPEFALLETIRWSPEKGYEFLDQHLARLHKSGEYFGRKIDRQAISHLLAEFAVSLPGSPQRVRLVIPERGEPQIEAQPLLPLPTAYCLRLAGRPIDSQDRFYYHKTTHRMIYEQALAEALADAPDCDDVLLWNERGEITESCIANVLVERDGRLFTPPIRCGLLPGIFRQRLLSQGRAFERIIRVQDLAPGTNIYLANSVRGLWQATLGFD